MVKLLYGRAACPTDKQKGMKTLRWDILGLGSIGQVDARYLLYGRIGRAVLAAVAASDAGE